MFVSKNVVEEKNEAAENVNTQVKSEVGSNMVSFHFCISIDFFFCFTPYIWTQISVIYTPYVFKRYLLLYFNWILGELSIIRDTLLT